MEGLQGDAVAGDGVFDGAMFGEVAEGEAQLIAGKLSEVGMVRNKFKVGEFPEVSVDYASGALLD